MGRVALLTRALITGQTGNLNIATQDKLHQPHRQSLFPAMKDIFSAALSAGADGVFLSGGGPAILAVSRGNLDIIGKAMQDKSREMGINGRIRVVKLSERGAQVL